MSSVQNELAESPANSHNNNSNKQQPETKNISLPEAELSIMSFWKDRAIYKKSLAIRRDAPRFVFFEGPPTANGLPHPGHCLTRAIKDLYPRYKTMRGFLCERKAGWDTHGLPVEVEVCKELGIHSKEEIEKYGIEPFVHRCRESVFRYMKEWENLTERIGFWVNLEEAYITYKKSYVESVWWSLKSLFERGLLYQGHKIVWWWAQGGTALSSGEVGQGYREVADPSLFVRFPLIDPLPDNDWKMFNEELAIAVNTKIGFTGVVDLIVWTTTPWTLPSNQFVAVNPNLDYAVVQFTNENGVKDERLSIIASGLVDSIAAKLKSSAEVITTFHGSDLVGKRYIPPFDFYYDHLGKLKGKLKESEGGGEVVCAWRVVAADFVTLDAGTGIVHQAPAFGEVDFDVLKAEQGRFESGAPELICAVAPNGCFTDAAPTYEGKWVKDADKEIIRDIKSKSILFHQEQYRHDYPFCWRAEQDPLIQYPRKSWFIKTTQFKDAMLKNNQEINWLPEHIKSGRFGNFLETNVDWALSRERFWGTPLPIWVCEETGQMEAIGSYDELLKKQGIKGIEVWENVKKNNPELSDDLAVHKPYIDAVSYDSPFAKGKRMYRVPEVIDCWYDSGAMPFAQWGFPHEHGSITKFRQHFPADFISEAIDQTRGWFYSQLAISTMIFDGTNAPYGGVDVKAGTSVPIPYPHPFKNCIVLGLMLGEDGQKMSKSKRNYREPNEIFNKYGADALRWYFYSNQTPWTAIRYNESAIRESIPEFILRLQNVVSFYEVYSKIDGFEPLKLVHPDVLRDDLGQMSPFCLASAKKSAKPYRSIKARPQLDYWILGEINRTIKNVCNAMDNFDHFTAAGELSSFVDALSNWYVRRNRDRFWSSGDTDDAQKIASKNDAYWTLYECLTIVAKLIAPFTPFLAESIWHRLVDINAGGLESVHLADYPVVDENLINEKMLSEIKLMREIVSLGRAARSNGHLKVRQPLAEMKVMFANDNAAKTFWESDVIDNVKVVQDELNIKGLRVLEDKEDFEQYVTFAIQPDFKKLGQKLLGKLPEVKKILSESDGAKLLAEMDKNKKITLKLSDESEVTINADEIQIRLQAKSGWVAAQGTECVVVLSTELTEELLSEGRAREIVRLIQDQRKELNLNYTDRILVGIETNSKVIGESLVKFCETIKNETLAIDLKKTTLNDTPKIKALIDNEELTISVKIS
ncbi:MAG: isoleucine--tRNA ligase [Planctomycetaceae bacterium]|jgi:isoleucyl-tRNA synthetase|nr:isoleucine--tRNA ligase [Planctomycetaceae bacterium]